MKVNEYVDRYYDGIKKNDDTAVNQLAKALLTECQAEFACYKDNSMSAAKYCIDKFNRKGNVISERFNQLAGRPLMKMNWFKASVKIETVSRLENNTDNFDGIE